MNNPNDLSVMPEYPKPAAKNYKNAIIGVLAFALLGVGGYTLVDKNKYGEINFPYCNLLFNHFV